MWLKQLRNAASPCQTTLPGLGNGKPISLRRNREKNLLPQSRPTDLHSGWKTCGSPVERKMPAPDSKPQTGVSSRQRRRSFQDRRVAKAVSKIPEADWMGVMIHAVFGFVAGGALGAVIIMRTCKSILVTSGSQGMGTMIAGAAFLGAGLGACYGDRLWMGKNHAVNPINTVRHTRTSKAFSIALACLGGLLIAGGFVSMSGSHADDPDDLSEAPAPATEKIPPPRTAAHRH